MLDIKTVENICHLRLNNGVTNAISSALIKHIFLALDEAEKNTAGLIIEGGEKFFSIGFNLPEIVDYKEEEMRNFYRSFNQLILKIYNLSIPTCAMIDGHAIAGGMILALVTDFRTASLGKKIFLGVNEIKLGVPVPLIADLRLRQITSHNNATFLLYSGEFINPLEGKETGIINELYSSEEIREKTHEKIKLFAHMPKDAFSVIKKNKTRCITEEYLKRQKSDEDDFIRCWFNENTRKLLTEAAKKF